MADHSHTGQLVGSMLQGREGEFVGSCPPSSLPEGSLWDADLTLTMLHFQVVHSLQRIDEDTELPIEQFGERLERS